MQTAKKIWLLWFVLFSRIAAAAWPPSINAWKGVVGVTLVEWLVVVGLSLWLRLATERELLFGLDRWLVQVALALLFAVNYMLLIHRGIGISYERDFGNLERSKRVRGIALSLAAVLGVVGFLAASVVAYNKLR